MSYADFLAAKAQKNAGHGFDPYDIPSHLFGFQAELVEWAIRQGRGAIFADCGLGKTPMELAWAANVHRHTGKPVLLLTPLAVGFQIVAEAHKFGHDAGLSRTGQPTAPITVTNYEQAAKFNPSDFGGVVCDESSAIKAFDGTTRAVVTELMREMPYRLLGTATAAPNDYLELGTSSEALGELGYMDMLSRFFVSDTRTSTHRLMASQRGKEGVGGAYRFKGHAEQPFWRWVSSWARAIRKPSDYGYADDGFHLPELREVLHVVESSTPREDQLFDTVAIGLAEERAELRRSLPDRCEKAAELVEPHDLSVLWCNLNDEGDMLERLVPNAIQVSGPDLPEYKEAAAQWFTGDLCICDNPLFRAKLATWDGSRNTPRTDAASTKTTQMNALAALAREELQKKTACTCASTTQRTPSGSSGTKLNAPSATVSDENGTPTTLNTGSASNKQPAPNAPPKNGTAASSASSASRQTTTTGCSPSKITGAPSAEALSEMARDGSSQLTTATSTDTSVGSCAVHATLASGSSKTILISSTRQGCICGHESGVRRLITKPRMFGYGLNFQHAHHMTYFPSHSYEQLYQAERRMWRFGQTQPVTVDVVASKGIANVLASLQRKSEQADRMFDALLSHMSAALRIQRHTDHTTRIEVPTWLAS